jgi:IK cytokine
VFTIAVKKAQETAQFRNDLFLSGRMAFVWDLGLGDGAEYIGSSDIPTIVVRSKADIKDFDVRELL